MWCSKVLKWEHVSRNQQCHTFRCSCIFHFCFAIMSHPGYNMNSMRCCTCKKSDRVLLTFWKRKKTSLCECVTANTRICAVKQQINSNNRTNQSKNKNGMCYRDPGAISKVIGKILNHVLSNSYWCLSQDDLITYFAWTTVLKPKILSLPTEREINKEKCDSSETRRYSGISL